MHAAAIFVLTLFVPGAAGPWLRYAWGVGAFFSLMALLLLLRVGSYEGTTDEEIADPARLLDRDQRLPGPAGGVAVLHRRNGIGAGGVGVAKSGMTRSGRYQGTTGS
jgi:hypothetical protein